MLDYFKVPEKDVVVVKSDILKETTKLMATTYNEDGSTTKSIRERQEAKKKNG